MSLKVFPRDFSSFRTLLALPFTSAIIAHSGSPVNSPTFAKLTKFQRCGKMIEKGRDIVAEAVEAVTTEVIKNKRERMVIEAKLARLAELKETMDRAKVESDLIKAEMTTVFVSNDVKKVLYAENTFTVYDGTHVSINADMLRASMLANNIKAGVVGKVIEESTKRTPYTTLVIKKV